MLLLDYQRTPRKENTFLKFSGPCMMNQLEGPTYSSQIPQCSGPKSQYIEYKPSRPLRSAGTGQLAVARVKTKHVETALPTAGTSYP